MSVPMMLILAMLFLLFMAKEKRCLLSHVQKSHQKYGFDGLAYDSRFLERELVCGEA